VSNRQSAELLESRCASQIAVLVIDVQTGLFEADPPPFETAEVIHRINFVTGRARSAGVRVVMVQHDGPPEGDWLVPLSEGWKLHPGLQGGLGDLFIRKSTADAFYGTSLEQELRSRGVQSLILAGYATEFCVDSTLRNAVSKDFEVFVVSDAHTTNDAPAFKASSIRQYFNWVWGETSSTPGIHVLPTAEIRFGTPARVKAGH
jgi:nicotinamidase-related amidase